ncbi:hypothetical protein GW17_00003858 [Ensete ventricosum]|nr:hypothetical protein GW17_00003858 [Ensete ventricosum]
MPHGINAPPAKTIPTRHGFPAAFPRRRVDVPSVRCLRIDGRIRLAEILVYPLRNSSIRFLIDWNLASSVGCGPECRRSVFDVLGSRICSGFSRLAYSLILLLSVGSRESWRILKVSTNLWWDLMFRANNELGH